MASRWSEISEDVLLNIFPKLDAANFIRVAAVCRWWRHCSISSRPSRLKQQTPWLMLSGKDDDRCMFSLTDKRTYRMRLPQIRNMHCAGSAFGWVVAMDSDAGDPFIFNPITGSTLRLPGINRLPWGASVIEDIMYGGLPYDHQLHPYKMLNKFILSPDSNSFVVVAIVMECRRLVVCRAGDESWTKMENPFPRKYTSVIHDAIFHKGCLYVVDQFHRLAIYNNLSVPPCMILSGTHIHHIFNEWMYLVESSSGQLLMVQRQMHGQSKYYTTQKMNVFQLTTTEEEEDEYCWSQVQSLSDEALFIGFSQGISFPTKDHPELRSNCIYFTDHNFYNIRRIINEARIISGGERLQRDVVIGKIDTHDVGIYDLQERTIHPLYKEEGNPHYHMLHRAKRKCGQYIRHPLWPLPVWFTPLFNF